MRNIFYSGLFTLAVRCGRVLAEHVSIDWSDDEPAEEQAESGSLEVVVREEQPLTILNRSALLQKRARLLGPGCNQKYSLAELVDQAPAWCDPNLVPPEKRAPPQLQGLYWMSGLTLAPYVAMCFSTAEWDAATRTLTVVAWRDFVWVQGWKTSTGITFAYQGGMSHKITFDSDTLESGMMRRSSTGSLKQRILGTIPAWLSNVFTDFRFLQHPAGEPGEQWIRPGFVGLGPAKFQMNQYELLRVLDGQGNLLADNHDFMLRGLEPKVGTKKLIRFFDKKGRWPFKKCLETAMQLRDPIPCGQGVFLATRHQPELGLLHMQPASDHRPFARVTIGERCNLTYSLTCQDNVAAVVEHKECPDNPVTALIIHSVTARQGKIRTQWKVCSRESNSAWLWLLEPVVDATWGSAMHPSEIDGCLELLPVSTWPQLAAVRGELANQATELMVQRTSAGGCPTLANETDRLERAMDFAEHSFMDMIGNHGSHAQRRTGPWMQALQQLQWRRAALWSTSTDLQQWQKWAMDDSLSGLLASSFTTAQPNLTAVFLSMAECTCGAQAPLFAGPMSGQYSAVSREVASASQLRAYVAATVDQVKECFDPTFLLFQSSGIAEHTQMRRLLDSVGFDRLESVRLPNVTGEIPKTVRRRIALALGNTLPSEVEVAGFVLPLLMEAIWKRRPAASEVQAVAPYVERGGLCTLGNLSFGSASSRAQDELMNARQAMQEFGRISPLAETLRQALELPQFAAVKEQYTSGAAAAGHADAGLLLIGNVADAVLSYGLLPTNDMAAKCVQYQWRDQAHVRMFRKNKTAYLQELMRYDGATVSFTAASAQAQTFQLEGRQVEFPAGTLFEMLLATANRDPKVFAHGNDFNMDRSDQAMQLAWGGKLSDVAAKNYTAAPRFCPGYQISLNIAAAVCTHLTRDLSSWGSDAHANTGGEMRAGLVRISKGGSRYEGQEALVTHFVGSRALASIPSNPLATLQLAYTWVRTVVVNFGSYCVVRPQDHKLIGCYRPHELEQLTGQHLITTLEQEQTQCPAWVGGLLFLTARTFISGKWLFSRTTPLSHAMDHLYSRGRNMTSNFVDEFALSVYALVTRTLMMSIVRHADAVRVPTHMGEVGLLKTGALYAPTYDIDAPAIFWPEETFLQNFIPKVHGFIQGYRLLTTCFMDILRNSGDGDFSDDMNSTDSNQWEPLLNPDSGQKYARKKDWLMSWYDPYKNAGGAPIWPRQQTDFSGTFLKADIWEDNLERSIAFKLIGAHRVTTLQDPPSQNSELRFVVQLNAPDGITNRPFFGKVGCDMYFDQDGFPRVVQTPTGDLIQRGDPDWQYWKFVWRSSLLIGVTLADHLYLSHFNVASVLAETSRRSLRPDHPMRRFMSVFTFGTIFVNDFAMRALMAPDVMFHRSSPFVEFESLPTSIPSTLPRIFEQHERFHNSTLMDAMDPLLKEAPYYKDGQLVYNALRRLVQRFVALYWDDFCTGSSSRPEASELREPQLVEFWDDLTSGSRQFGNYQGSRKCDDFMSALTKALFTVTAYHAHVGGVFDYFSDPDLVGISWKEGEPFSRPKQSMIWGAVIPFTGTNNPKLTEDYTHLFSDIARSSEAKAVWRSFRGELQEAEQQIKANNKQRLEAGEIDYIYMDPSVIECSVAK